MSDRKPNWTKWKLIPKAKVWQVVALSLDLDPDKVTRGKEDWMAGGAFVNHEGKDFQYRFDVIIANCSYTKDDLLYIGLGGQHTGYGDLNIPKFAQWALSVNLDIPPELEALATHAALSTKEFSYVEREARSNLISSA